jgi:hypothetical protein
LGGGGGPGSAPDIGYFRNTSIVRTKLDIYVFLNK